MQTVFMLVGYLVGLCAFGLLLAAAMTFSGLTLPKPSAPRSAHLRFAAIEFLSGGLFSLTAGIARHWRSRRDLRLLTYSGFGCLFVSIASLYLSLFGL